MIVPGGKPTIFFAMLMLGEPGVEIMYSDPRVPDLPVDDRVLWRDADPDRAVRGHRVQLRCRSDAGPCQRPNTADHHQQSDEPNRWGDRSSQLDVLVKGLKAYLHVTVLSDEIYSRILYDGREQVSLIEYESIRDRLILLNGQSKTHSMTGWRLGWGLWPVTMIECAERLQINSNSCASTSV